MARYRDLVIIVIAVRRSAA